jgi:membrane protein implicated in regulation of membrane protease activity
VVTQQVVGGTGRTFAGGAWWTVRSTGGPLHDGGTVRVVGLDGLTLLAEPGRPDDTSERNLATGKDDQ